jgi:hypothetical protein
MSKNAQAEVLNVCLAPTVYESGGAYGQKGVDFQRYWAISRIIELADANEPDFLILFESIQDVIEFNNSANPTKAKVYQLKMKDTGAWTWKDLTALPPSVRKNKNSSELTTPKPFTASPIGKLALALAEFPTIESDGVFVSNLGSDAETEKGRAAGSVRVCKFSELDPKLREQIEPELAKLKTRIPLDRLHLHKTELSLDDPHTHVSGKLNAFLLKVAPKHAGQCKSFADSLFAVLSARGRRSDPPSDFASLVKTRGYSKEEFSSAITDLQSLPDQQALVASWLDRLNQDKMPLIEFTRLQVKLTQLLEERLRTGADQMTALRGVVRNWVSQNPAGDDVTAFIRAGTEALRQHVKSSIDELQAVLVLEGIAQCLNQI